MVTQKNSLVEPKGSRKRVKPQYAAQQTLQYTTFLKRTFKEALENAFEVYEGDPTLQKTKIGIDYSMDSADFPTIVIKWYEQSIRNIGVGHSEWGPDGEQDLIGSGNLEEGSGVISELESVEGLYPGETGVTGEGVPVGAFILKIIDSN